MGSIRISRNLGLILAGVWLILFGIFSLFKNVLADHQTTILGILALVAGVLVFIEFKD